MGSIVMFSEDRKLRAERRRAKQARDRERREAREAKRSRLVAGDLRSLSRLLESGGGEIDSVLSSARPRRRMTAISRPIAAIGLASENAVPAGSAMAVGARGSRSPRVREGDRSEARIERERERGQERERKRSQAIEPPVELSAVQWAPGERVRRELDRIVAGALERHDALGTTETPVDVARAERTGIAAPRSAAVVGSEPAPAAPAGPVTASARDGSSIRTGHRMSRRDREIAEFRERRQRCADEARGEARRRIARIGEAAAVADALAAIRDPGGDPWRREREQLEQTLDSVRRADVGAVARRALWAVSRDAARSSRRSGRDPELALAVCVAYAIVARLPRTAVRSEQHISPRPFWR